MSDDGPGGRAGSLRLSPGRIVAEIGVIVVGVLLALGADAWWQGRQEAELSAAYRDALTGDLVADSALFQLLVGPERDWLPGAEGAFDSLSVAVADDRSRDPVRVAGWLTRSYRVLAGTKSRATYDEMIATGRLELIGELEFRRALADYYQTSLVIDDRLNGALLAEVWLPFFNELRRIMGPVWWTQMEECIDVAADPDRPEAELQPCLEELARPGTLDRITSDPDVVALMFGARDYAEAVAGGARAGAATQRCLLGHLRSGGWTGECGERRVFGARWEGTP